MSWWQWNRPSSPSTVPYEKGSKAYCEVSRRRRSRCHYFAGSRRHLSVNSLSARRKADSVAERVGFGPWVSLGQPSGVRAKTIVPIAGGRGFESRSLQRGVMSHRECAEGSEIE